jgi:flagellar basal-body rod protein FlgF
MEQNATYLLGSALMVMERYNELESNNAANTTTLGFKRRDLIIQGDNVSESFKSKLTFPNDVASPINLSPGAVAATHQALDVAIQGAGYFVVETAAGTKRYTRSGAFRDSQGSLTTQDGQSILGVDGQPIALPQDLASVDISPAGLVASKGELIGQLAVVDFPPDAELFSEGGNLYSTVAQPAPAADFKITQGVLEESNVNAIIQMQRVIEIQRIFSGITEVMISRYKLMETMLSTMSRVRA